MDTSLDQDFWTNRYQTQDTGWDIGYISTPLKEYIDQIENKDIKILIPGAGNSYEAEYLWENKFQNVYVLDVAEVPLTNIQKRCPRFPSNQLLQQDFFEHQGEYDLILEQTFFCALEPRLRQNYVEKILSLLKEDGKLAGVLFKDIFLERDEPPFGATKDDYLAYFENNFKFKYFDDCYNSIPPRQGSELFIHMSKQNKT